MGVNLAQLAAAGRAYSPARPWHPEELEALLTLERERGLERKDAASYVRNGIMTPDAYDKAKAAEFVPKTLDAAQDELEGNLKRHGAAFASAGEPVKKPATKAKPKTSKKAQ